MRFGETQFKVLALVAFILVVLFWFVPRQNSSSQTNDQISNLVPQAFEMFDHCLNAAYLGEPLDTDTIADKLNSEIEITPDFAGGELSLETGENFECVVEIPYQYYDRNVLRERLEVLRTTRSDDRLRRCRWRISSQQTSASVLDCSFKSDTESKTSFRISFLSIASDSAFFWIRPSFTFDSDGRIISIND